MGFWDNLFGSGDQTYPTRHTGAVPDPCGSGPYEMPDGGGFFNKLLAPKQLAYPTPACYRPLPTPPTPPLVSPPAPAIVPVVVTTPAPTTPATPTAATPA